jgi:hypothetical protein
MSPGRCYGDSDISGWLADSSWSLSFIDIKAWASATSDHQKGLKLYMLQTLSCDKYGPAMLLAYTIYLGWSEVSEHERYYPVLGFTPKSKKEEKKTSPALHLCTRGSHIHNAARIWLTIATATQQHTPNNYWPPAILLFLFLIGASNTLAAKKQPTNPESTTPYPTAAVGHTSRHKQAILDTSGIWSARNVSVWLLGTRLFLSTCVDSIRIFKRHMWNLDVEQT